jgi:serine/threonine-protein kinase RsbT
MGEMALVGKDDLAETAVRGAAFEIRVPIRSDVDVVVACQKGRALASGLGFSSDDQVIVVIAISEVAHNIIRYAGSGEIIFSPVGRGERYGISIIARDEGPGIPDIELALQDGYSTGGSLGLGLSGAKRLMDEFDIVSQVNLGTTVTMRKWGV